MRRLITITLIVVILAQLLAVACTNYAAPAIVGSKVVYGNTTLCDERLAGEDSTVPQCQEVTLQVTVQNVGASGNVTVWVRINYDVDYSINDVKYRETKVYLNRAEQETILFPFRVPATVGSWTYQAGTS